jgi:hypothetical protein
MGGSIMTPIQLAGLVRPLLFVVCLNLVACGGGDSGVQPIAGIKTNAPAAPDPALIPDSTVITLTYNASMDPASLVLGGDMAADSNGGVWSTTNLTNDTLILSPASAWALRTGRHLVVDAKDTTGRAARTVDQEYDIYQGVLYYVNFATGNDGNLGDSPVTAFKNIHTAVNSVAPSATILVAQGNYAVNYNPDTRIWLRQDISLYGGYSSDFKLRDPLTYVTSITDTSNIAATLANPNFAVIASNSAITNSTLVDGFQIKGSQIVGAVYTSAIRVHNGANPSLANNQIYGGAGSAFNTGIVVNYSSPRIYANRITGLSGGTSAYGIYTNNASPVIFNNTIIGASAPVLGTPSTATAGIYIVNSIGSVRNNSIDGGDGSSKATGIEMVGNSSTTAMNIENNIVFTRTGTGSSCIAESVPTGAGNATPLSLRNNDLFNCDVVYVDYEMGCTGNADGDNNAQTCTLAEMNALSDITVVGVSNNISVDPLLADIDGADNQLATLNDNDWHFSAGSSASVTAGGLNGVDEGWSFSTDTDNVVRPASGKPWSIGAYEP